MVCFKDPQPAPPNDDEDMEDIVRKMHGLLVHDPDYTVLYSHCLCHFPKVAEHIEVPSQFSGMMALAYQTPASPTCQQPNPTTACKTWPQATATAATPSIIDPNVFFSHKPKIQQCTFCALPSHIICSCPTAEEYCHTKSTIIISDCIHLPTGQPVSNNGSRHSPKHAIDTWLAANGMSHGSNPSPSMSATATMFQHDHPSHLSLSFKAIRPGAPLAYITEITDHNNNSTPDSGSDKEDNDLNNELYDMFKVFASK